MEEEHCRQHSAQEMVQASQRPHLFSLARSGREGDPTAASEAPSKRAPHQIVCCLPVTCNDGHQKGVLFGRRLLRNGRWARPGCRTARGSSTRSQCAVRPRSDPALMGPATAHLPSHQLLSGRLGPGLMASLWSSGGVRLPDQAPGTSRRRTTGCGSGCSANSRRCRACSGSSSTTRRCWRARSSSRARRARRSRSSCTTSRCPDDDSLFTGPHACPPRATHPPGRPLLCLT